MRARLIALGTSLLFAGLWAVVGAPAASAAMPAAHHAHPVADSAALITPALVAEGDDVSPPALKGNLRYKGTDDDGKSVRIPVPGVTITALLDGEEVGDAVSDDNGDWIIGVPEAARYEVVLDVDSLPEGVTLRSEDAQTLEGVRVQSTQVKVANFALDGGASTGSAASSSGSSQYMNTIVAGLRFGLIIAMAAIGLSLVFGTTGLINFAHGEMVTMGAVITYGLAMTSIKWPFLLALAVAIAAVAVLGGLMEIGLWRPLRKRGTGLIQMFIVSIGLALLLRHGIELFFGDNRRPYKMPSSMRSKVDFGLGDIMVVDLIVICISIVVLIAVALMLQRTRMGKAMRALSDNQDLAEASGIDVKRVILNVWILGGGLAALGGVFLGLTTVVHWQMGWYLLLLMFAGVILGGIGSAYGAIIGSILVGMIVQVSQIWFDSQLQNAWALFILVLVLLVRPQGILGRAQRAG